MMYALKSMSMFTKTMVKRFLSDEKGEVNIVAIVVLIGIAVLLALIFKDQITGLLETLFGTITESATDAVTKKGP